MEAWRHGRQGGMEAGRQGAVGQGPGWLQAIGTAQPRGKPGDDRMGTVAMETQATQANHGNW